MNWKSFKARGFVLLLLLGMTCSLVGCQSILPSPTHSGAIKADEKTTSGVCEAWQGITYSSHDTEQTQKEVRGNNAARTAYGCPQ